MKAKRSTSTAPMEFRWLWVRRANVVLGVLVAQGEQALVAVVAADAVRVRAGVAEAAARNFQRRGRVL